MYFLFIKLYSHKITQFSLPASYFFLFLVNFFKIFFHNHNLPVYFSLNKSYSHNHPHRPPIKTNQLHFYQLKQPATFVAGHLLLRSYFCNQLFIFHIDINHISRLHLICQNKFCRKGFYMLL